MNEQPVNALPQGHRIEEYELERVLRAGDFDITYLASDRNLNAKVVLKEYLPSEIVRRTADNSVEPQEDTFREDFEWGMEQFLDQTRTLAQFQHPNIVRVHRSFEAQGTAYMAMEYVKGETLAEVLALRMTLSESALRDMLQRLLAGLAVVHEANLLHGDINPENIVLRNEGDSPVLLDFGAARQAIGARIRPDTPVVTPGYAPPEQYSAQGEQGPWTDLYALGGVCYRALTGQTPADATDQSRQDPLTLLRRLCGDHVSAATLDAIGWALRVDAPGRPQDVAAWRANFLGEAEVPADAGEAEAALSLGPIRLPWRNILIWGGLVALVVLVGVVGYRGMRDKAEQSQRVAESARQAASEEERAAEAARDVASEGERVAEERPAESSGQMALEQERPVESSGQVALEQERPAESSGESALEQERPVEAARQVALERQRQEESARQAALERERAAEAARQAALERQRQEESARQAALERERAAEAARQAALEQERQAEAARQAALEEERQAEAARQAALERERAVEAARQVGASMEFVWIRPGSFKMGSPSSERGCDDESRHCQDEGPVHKVEISQGFWLGKYEVTQGQWKAVMGRNPSEFQGDDQRPVERVSWRDVHAFIGWLNDAAGDSLYRLPSEAEWEYACRAGSSGRWAGRRLGDYAWYRKNSGYGTQAVGGKSPNRWGLHDMHGNVAEWVQDWYDEDYYASSSGVDPRGPTSGSYRVLRGGHFISSAEYVRSALRYHTSPSNNDGHFGVRLVRIR